MTPPVAERTSFGRDTLAPAGVRGRLNHRGVWVLKAIGAEPGLSNREVAERVGDMDKGHVSMVLGRLRRLGLIENTQADPTPYVPNAWRLTDGGVAVERSLRHETLTAAGPATGPRDRLANRLHEGGRSHGSAVGSASGLGEARRARLLAAAARQVCAGGVQSVSVERVAAAARVSPDIFYEIFADRDAVVMAAFEDALSQAEQSARAAFEAHDGWLDGVRAGLHALLELFDEQPALARLLVVHSSETLALGARRAEVLARLTAVLDEERAPARRYPPSLTAEGLVSGVLGVLQGRLVKRDAGALVELSSQLMSMIVLPYLGARAARRELSRPVRASARPVSRKAALELLQGTTGKAAKRHLTPRVLALIAAEPGLGNTALAARAGVKDQGHMSRLLARLARLGLIESVPGESQRASAKAWTLTDAGNALERALRDETLAASGGRQNAAGAVSKTATTVLVPRYREHRGGRARESMRSIARGRLALLAAFDLPLLRCVRRDACCALPAARSRSLPWLNKRSPARYSISPTYVKSELSHRHKTAATERRILLFSGQFRGTSSHQTSSIDRAKTLI
jgi:DNA-binding MarR family transcriptional regulator